MARAPGEVVTALEQCRCRWADEAELQAELAVLLPDFKREDIAGADRFDFRRDDGLVIEVKTKGSIGAVLRQLARYADRDDVSSLILATTKANLGKVPRALCGKPVRVARLWLWGVA